MKIVLGHPTPNGFVRSLATELLESGMLGRFYTTFATFPGSLSYRMGVGPLSDIRRRSLGIDMQPVTKTSPWREASRVIALKVGLGSVTVPGKGFLSSDTVNKQTDLHMAANLDREVRNGADGIYSYEDFALNSFQKATELGLSRFYDLPIGYWRAARRLLEAESQIRPQWANTITGLNDREEKLLQKDEELRLADRIFVASTFTAKTLDEFPGTLSPIKVIPYGFPPVTNEREYSRTNGPLKLLFVGGLSQRKGIANLFEAVEPLKDQVELTIVGRKMVGDCEILNRSLTKHRWIPTLAHDEVLKLMRTQDVLVFPSLFEGFGLVITEAMSQGTPVITTERTAGPDLIEHGRNGWLIDAGSTESLQRSIEDILADRSVIADMGKESMQIARTRPWSVYGREVMLSIREYYEGK